MQLIFRNLDEERPGEAWRRVFAHAWPGWRRWFLARGGERGPGVGEARTALRRHMPEFERLWERLVEAVGADEAAERFLSFWTPPRYLVHCSQAVMVDQQGPLLVRNYDLDPKLNESTLLMTAWHGRRVMGMVEGMAGLADGMNEAGLAASLTFGGRPAHGRGFGVPLILRYVLETCVDTHEAVAALRAVPCHMSYNVTVLDRGGRWATVFLAPDRPAIVTRSRYATNHQLGVEWPTHARVSNTLVRERHLRKLLAQDDLDGAGLARSFTEAPLFATNYARGFGTVYTATYRPATGEATLLWSDGSARQVSFDDFERPDLCVRYSPSGSVAHLHDAVQPDALRPATVAADTPFVPAADRGQGVHAAVPAEGRGCQGDLA